MTIYKENPIIHEKVSPVFERSIAYLENLMVVVCDFTNGPMNSPDPPHSHPHEQITFVAKGELFFYRGEQEYHLVEGDVITIPPDVPHCIKNISNHVRLVDTFNPIRRDFLKQH